MQQHQLLVVTTLGWNEKQGKLVLYERANNRSAWTAIQAPIADLNRVLFWLDRKKNPALVQLPLHKYHALQNEWNLPALLDR